MERYDFDFNKAPEFSSLRKELESYEGIGGDTEVESKIWDTLAVLNLVGFQTHRSCEGHIVNKETRDEFIEGDFVFYDITQGPYIVLKGSENEQEFIQKGAELELILDEFYKKRQSIDPQIMLTSGVLSRKNGRYIIQSKEEQFLRDNLEEIKIQTQFIEKNMDIIQQEFEDFAKFLYKKWLAGYRFGQ